MLKLILMVCTEKNKPYNICATPTCKTQKRKASPAPIRHFNNLLQNTSVCLTLKSCNIYIDIFFFQSILHIK